MRKSMNQITKSGYDNIIIEIKQLKEERNIVLERLNLARSFGDLRENSEYTEARTRLSDIDNTIFELENVLSNSIVIDELPNTDIVILGCFVEVMNIDNKECTTYRIVNDIESDFSQNKISINSPFAKSLLNKRKDDIIDFITPICTRQYKIINIK